MPLVSQADQVRLIYDEARRRGLALGCFCTENQRTTEAIIQATYELARELDEPELPVVVGFTAGYPPRSNATQYTSLGDPLVGAQALVDDLRLLLSPQSPYHRLRVMLHLDHGQPEGDAALMEKYLDVLASVMYDASELPLAENLKRTARFVARHRDRVLIEGAVDEIYDSDSAAQKDELTDPEVASRYLRETGVDLLVPNVGTEHRAAAGGRARYQGEQARAIARRVGPRLCLHGASSLKPADFGRLSADGFVKVNLWTALVRTGGQAVARDAVLNLGNILGESDIEGLQRAGYLGPRLTEPDYVGTVCGGRLGPKLAGLTEEHRRRVWTAAVVPTVKGWLRALGYERWARPGGGSAQRE